MGNYHEIRERLGGDFEEPWFVIHRGPTILALALREDLNPRVHEDPSEVWVGDAEIVIKWGDKLAKHPRPFPVYVSRYEGDDFELKGEFKVLPRRAADDYFQEVRRIARRGLSRILYLAPAEPTTASRRRLSERLETGNIIKHDQTVTIRVNEAKKKAQGIFKTQCTGGCGRYLTKDEQATHRCTGPRRIRMPKRTRRKKAMRAARSKAAKFGRST